MTKDIMLRISGVQFPDGEENSEEMEVITSGSYFEKDGRHYIKYDEVQEDSNEVIRNLLKIENGSLELTRRGMTNGSAYPRNGYSDNSPDWNNIPHISNADAPQNYPGSVPVLFPAYSQPGFCDRRSVFLSDIVNPAIYTKSEISG